jgi:hypothetical protein
MWVLVLREQIHAANMSSGGEKVKGKMVKQASCLRNLATRKWVSSHAPADLDPEA